MNNTITIIITTKKKTFNQKVQTFYENTKQAKKNWKIAENKIIPKFTKNLD